MRLKTRVLLAIGCVSLLAMSIPAFSVPAPRGLEHQRNIQKKKIAQPAPAGRAKPQAARLVSMPMADAPKRPMFGWPALVSEARKYIGTNPTARTRLWCATFMNLVLAKAGYAGTNSDAAKSFAQYGHRISEPQVGAIAAHARQARRPCRRGLRHRLARQPDHHFRQSWPSRRRGSLFARARDRLCHAVRTRSAGRRPSLQSNRRSQNCWRRSKPSRIARKPMPAWRRRRSRRCRIAPCNRFRNACSKSHSSLCRSLCGVLCSLRSILCSIWCSKPRRPRAAICGVNCRSIRPWSSCSESMRVRKLRRRRVWLRNARSVRPTSPAPTSERPAGHPSSADADPPLGNNGVACGDVAARDHFGIDAAVGMAEIVHERARDR
jgi:hypothetical protein